MSFIMDCSIVVSFFIAALCLAIAACAGRSCRFMYFRHIFVFMAGIRVMIGIFAYPLLLAYGHESKEAMGKILGFVSALLFGIGADWAGLAIAGIVIPAVVFYVRYAIASGIHTASRQVTGEIPRKDIAITRDLAVGIIDRQEAERRNRELNEVENFNSGIAGSLHYEWIECAILLMVVSAIILNGIILGAFVLDMPLVDTARIYGSQAVSALIVCKILAIIMLIDYDILLSRSLKFSGVSEPAEQLVRSGREAESGDAILLELGYDLLPLIEAEGGLLVRIPLLRYQIAQEIGIALPSVRIRDNITREKKEYSIGVFGFEHVKGVARNPGEQDDDKAVEAIMAHLEAILKPRAARFLSESMVLRMSRQSGSVLLALLRRSPVTESSPSSI